MSERLWLLREEILKNKIQRLEYALDIYKEASYECVAIGAHVDPETYSNSEAVTMILNELTRADKEVKEILRGLDE